MSTVIIRPVSIESSWDEWIEFFDEDNNLLGFSNTYHDVIPEDLSDKDSVRSFLENVAVFPHRDLEHTWEVSLPIDADIKVMDTYVIPYSDMYRTYESDEPCDTCGDWVTEDSVIVHAGNNKDYYAVVMSEGCLNFGKDFLLLSEEDDIRRIETVFSEAGYDISNILY